MGARTGAQKITTHPGVTLMEGRQYKNMSRAVDSGVAAFLDHHRGASRLRSRRRVA